MKRWLDSWSVNEDEPSWLETIFAGFIFVLLMAALYGGVLLVAASMDVL